MIYNVIKPLDYFRFRNVTLHISHVCGSSDIRMHDIRSAGQRRVNLLAPILRTTTGHNLDFTRQTEVTQGFRFSPAIGSISAAELELR